MKRSNVDNRGNGAKAQYARIAEAQSAIARIEATMVAGNNRFGIYGDNCRDSIKRWEAAIRAANDRLADLGVA